MIVTRGLGRRGITRSLLVSAGLGVALALTLLYVVEIPAPPSIATTFDPETEARLEDSVASVGVISVDALVAIVDYVRYPEIYGEIEVQVLTPTQTVVVGLGTSILVNDGKNFVQVEAVWLTS